MEAHEGDPREHYLLAREHLAWHWRDALDIIAGTGWHVSEIQRFAEDGRVGPYPRQGDVEGVAGVLVCPSHKNGEELRTGASAAVVDAARRLRERGSLSMEKFGLAVRAACRVAGIPEFSPGRFRHSVATRAINQGAAPATVAAFLNHKSPMGRASPPPRAAQGLQGSPWEPIRSMCLGEV